MKQFIIGENEAGQRLDKYLKKLLPEAPGSFLYKMLRKKNITLNGRKASGDEKTGAGHSINLPEAAAVLLQQALCPGLLLPLSTKIIMC